ncbi:MAG: DUF2780 domain-containing protein [Deltaproteobacteria bacterium]|nr:DUF2780 domain-containing protein [Deltaproteobacteria bacterium]
MKPIQTGIWMLGMVLLLVGALGLNVGHAGGMELVSMLVDKLGVSQEQATGGAGALFQNAKENLSTEAFQKVADAVPGMDKYLAAAPAKSEAGSALGSLSSLGKGAGKLGSMAGLADSFKSLGMDSGMVSKFAPVVMEYVQSKGGDSVAGLLKGLWK